MRKALDHLLLNECELGEHAHLFPSAEAQRPRPDRFFVNRERHAPQRDQASMGKRGIPTGTFVCDQA
jgi:hypothetical protein